MGAIPYYDGHSSSTLNRDLSLVLEPIYILMKDMAWGRYHLLSFRSSSLKADLEQIMFIGSLSQVISYAMESPRPPFPVMVLAYALAGFGIALQVNI